MADWTLSLVEREDGRYTFTLTDNINVVDHTPQRSYVNREAAIEAATDMRDTIIGGDTRSNTIYDFDPLP